MSWSPWEDLLAVVELAAPTACAGCAEPGQRWCQRCASELRRTAPRSWTPTPPPSGMPPTWSGPSYADPVRSAIVAWKDHGRADLTGVFAPVLRDIIATALAASTLHCDPGGRVLLLPAPSARAGTRARGEHRVGALARASVRGIAGHRVQVSPALRLGRPVADQAGLSAAARAANLSGAVEVRRRERPRVVGRPCVLVDDVVTTGATLAECARALREAGAGQVIAVTLAATQRDRRGVLPQPHIAD